MCNFLPFFAQNPLKIDETSIFSVLIDWTVFPQLSQILNYRSFTANNMYAKGLTTDNFTVSVDWMQFARKMANVCMYVCSALYDVCVPGIHMPRYEMPWYVKHSLFDFRVHMNCTLCVGCQNQSSELQLFVLETIDSNYMMIAYCFCLLHTTWNVEIFSLILLPSIYPSNHPSIHPSI